MSPLIPPGHLETGHTMFSKPVSLQGTFWSQSFAHLQNCVSFALPCQALNSVPGSISESVIGSFRAEPAVGCLITLVRIHLGEKIDARTRCSLQNLPMLPISKKHCRVASEKTSCVSKPPPTLCCQLKIYLCLEMRTILKLFWTVLQKVI